MAGRQVRFYLHPEDRTEVESFVTGDLDSALLAPRWPTASPLRIADSGEILALICPNALVDSLRPRRIDSRAEWVLSAGHDPVIEWWRSRLTDGELYPGRFYYISGSGEGQDSSGAKLLDVVAQELIGWVKKFAGKSEVDWGFERLSPTARIKLAAGEIHLRRNPRGSRI